MKILIIWYNKIDENGSLGGVEKYNLNLINFFLKKNYKIDFLYLNDIVETNNEKINYIKIKQYEKKQKVYLQKNKFLYTLLSFFSTIKGQLNSNKNKKIVNKYIKKNKNKYFLIICNIPFYFSKSIRQSNNFVYVMHMDYKVFEKFFWYNQINYSKYLAIYKGLLLILNKAVFSDKNILKKTKNVVFFSDNNIYSQINKNPLLGSIPLDMEFSSKKPEWYLKNKKNESILYFGRLDNDQKNIDLVSEIASCLKKNIDIYGHGPYFKNLEKNKYLNLKGKINSTKDKINFLKDFDFFLMTSHYEGLPIAAIELLSMGIIGVIRNSFLEAKSLIPKKYYNLLLVDKDYNCVKYSEIINKINALTNNEKNEIRLDLIHHIKKYFSNEIFEKNWNKILEKMNIL